jgi:hypothetical protein
MFYQQRQLRQGKEQIQFLNKYMRFPEGCYSVKFLSKIKYFDTNLRFFKVDLKLYFYKIKIKRHFAFSYGNVAQVFGPPEAMGFF